MPGLMPTYDSLSPDYQLLARSMANAARHIILAYGGRLLQDDHAARLDEACAVYLKASMLAHAPKHPVSRFYLVDGGNVYTIDDDGELFTAPVNPGGGFPSFVSPVNDDEWHMVEFDGSDEAVARCRRIEDALRLMHPTLPSAGRAHEAPVMISRTSAKRALRHLREQRQVVHNSFAVRGKVTSIEGKAELAELDRAIAALRDGVKRATS